MLDKIYSLYERNVKFALLIVSVIFFTVMAYLYVKS